MYGAYVINVCGERCQVHKLGEIKLGLWEKLKLALYADFLILCISSRYCLCVSKCTLLHKLCSSYFFDNPDCAHGQGLWGGSEAAQSDFLTFFMCLECANC